MDTTQIIIAAIAVLSPLVSYMAARHKNKTDLTKLSESHKADIEKLLKQHEVNLESLKENHKFEMERKDKDQEHKLQCMQKECDLKVNHQQQTQTNNIMNDVLGGFVSELMKNPNTAIEKIQNLEKLGNMFNDSSQ